ncbi:MAG: hypothetical protein ACLVH0_04410 [Coprococcus eutactus]
MPPAVFQGGEEHPDKGEHHHQCADDQHHVFDDGENRLAGIPDLELCIFLFIVFPPLHVVDKFLETTRCTTVMRRTAIRNRMAGCRSVVDLSLIVEHPINVVHDGDSGVSRVGGSAGIGDEHGIDLVESAGHVNHGHQNHHPDGGLSRGSVMRNSVFVGGGAVDPCSLIDLLVNLLQTRQKQKDLKRQTIPDREDGKGSRSSGWDRSATLRTDAKQL